MQCNEKSPIPDVIKQAAEILCHGGIVLYPTETFFAIGCLAREEQAIKRIYQLKRRKEDIPLPVIIGKKEQLHDIAMVRGDVMHDVDMLCAFWPAPLTLLLPSLPALPDILTAQTGKIAVRISAHPIAAALATLCGSPIVSTSANISGCPAATQFSELPKKLIEELRPNADMALDLLPLPSGGLASTIVEPLGNLWLRIIRYGAFDTDLLQKSGFRFAHNREAL